MSITRTPSQNWYNLNQRSIDMDKAIQIRMLRKEENISYDKLAELFSLSKTTIIKIVQNKMYKE